MNLNSPPRIAVQARPWGLGRVAADYPAVFDEMIAAGYDGAEGRYTLLEDEKGIAAYLDRRPGFSLIALHAGLSSFEGEAGAEELKRLLERMNRTGSRYLLASMGREAGDARWLERAGELSRQCADSGVQFCYHNHAEEFEGGFRLFDRLTGEYGVKLAADVAWIHLAGADPAEFVDRYADSIAYVHLKDVRDGVWKELGDGEMALGPLLDRVAALRLPWWTVEQDTTERAPAESARKSREYLRAALAERTGEGGE
ncbi:sugar phosphate isomerase/epimerase family protein [Cohnella zeiphila]|uniref:Sugar phosphate isomerase/epimerase n=1 Tax=Cohnella zeiphila TaxID=2761120 RepID=A0A7X0SLQ8_9BACL|nr:sugar phosphate isomerase/epimerase [Cohnella zeiphila]MBB6732327.1 sugar phosphate isomerase/epimerase [Cohnella zeiphila]